MKRSVLRRTQLRKYLLVIRLAESVKKDEDASSSRKVRIRRRERTYSYVTKTKRKLDEEIRSGFSVYRPT